MSFKKNIINNNFIYSFYKRLKILRAKKFNKHLGEFGEDIFISRFFKKKNNGIYVDIGCYHPIKGSLTYNLFKIEGLETLCEDYGQVAVYKGNIPEMEHFYKPLQF